MNRNSFFRSRKFKYGSIATAFTVAFVAIVVIFNIIFSALAQKYMWYIDMTKEQVFTLSEEAKEIMSDITEDVYIHFASEPDELMNGTNSSYTRYIYTTALQLEEEFPNVHVDAVSVLKNPSYFREFYQTTASDIDTTNVIVESGGEVRNFAATAFFTFNDVNDPSTVWAYSGEKRMISGIMQVTQTDKPIVCFTTEHGEALNTQDALTLFDLFDSNGFTVMPVNLAQDTVDDDCRIMVVYDPAYDFIGAEAEDQSRNEIEKIDKFLDRYGCLIVFGDPAHVDKLTNLNEFLEEWGIAFVGQTTVRDSEHAMSVDGYSVIAEYQKDTLGASIYSDLNNLATPPKSIIRKSAPIEILWEQGGGLNGSREVSPVLKSYDTAELIKDGMVTDTGSFNLVTISREERIVSNEYYYSYVIAAGSPTFAGKSYLDSNAYANDDILAASMKAVGRERVLAVLERKPFDKSDITVTTAEANHWTVRMTTILPAIFAVAGLVVITRRKHS
ncbi:MAG: GldG family protein [Clostridia bacterium]|nr:GldG family protein [Clostridia bacterium]